MSTENYSIMDDAQALVDHDGICAAGEAGNITLETFTPVRDIVTRAASAARESGIYQSDSAQSRIGDYLAKYKAMPKEKIFHVFWMDFLYKIVNSPTSFHRVGAVIVFMPMLDDLLNYFADTQNAADNQL